MSAPSFTPGPWAVQTRRRNRICGPEGVIVGEAWFPPAKTKRDAKMAAWEQGNVNAQLMAASPDLYGALVEMLEIARLGNEDGAFIARAEAALSQARGESGPVPTALHGGRV